MENTTFTEENMILATESKSISKVEQLVDDICKNLNVHKDYYGNILIALTEAVNNAIQHGNKKDPSKQIKLSYEAKNEKLGFTIEDEGEGFDFENLPDPTDPEFIDKPNGRGVFLMKHLADEVNFYNEGKKVELKFNYSIN